MKSLNHAILLLLSVAVIASMAAAEGVAQESGFKQMPAEQFTKALADCREFEDSVRGPMCSFTGKEFTSPNGDPAIEEKNREFEGKWFRCMELSFHADALYKKGEITEQQYKDATGQGEQYTFGSLGSFEMTQCFYTNCKLVVKYYLDSANAQTNPGRKAELYQKAIDNYFMCMKTAMSDVVHPAAFDSSLGKLGENDDQLNADASDAYLGLCETKIRAIREKIARETDPQEKIGLYDELENEIYRCASLGMSALVDPGSKFAEKLDIMKGRDNEDENAYSNQLIDAMRKKCGIRLGEARKKVAEAKTPEQKAKADDELAKVFVECYLKSYDTAILPQWDTNPFDYAGLGEAELDAVTKACAEKIKALEEERKKPLGQREDGRNDYNIELLLKALRKDCGLQETDVAIKETAIDADGYLSQGMKDIIKLAPDRFTQNAGVYTIPIDKVSIIYIDGGINDGALMPGTATFALLDPSMDPSPKAFVTLGANAGITFIDVTVPENQPAKDRETSTATSPDANAGKKVCDETVECMQWSDWQWDYCKGDDGKGGGVQEGKRVRNCKTASTCQKEEIKIRECNPELDADISIIVDGTVSQEFSPDRNNQIKIKSWRPLALPIMFTLQDPTPESLVDEARKNGKATETDYADYLRAIILYRDPIGDELAAIQKKFLGSTAICQTPNECTTNVSDKWNIVLKWRKSPLTFGVKDKDGLKKEFKAGVKATAVCAENWSCGEWLGWGTCSNGTQGRARTCTDASNCGTTASRPATSESQSCQQQPAPCTESWNCGEWGAWSEPGSCQESGTQAKTRARTCTDASNCGTTAQKPQTSESATQSCAYTPTEQKPEYSAHETTLGANTTNLNYASDSKTFDLSLTGGQYGYRILNIPSHATVKICISASAPFHYNSYPQYHYGYDWSSAEWEAANPGCMSAYNKNAWANGILVHMGDPDPANVTGTITVSQINQ